MRTLHTAGSQFSHHRTPNPPEHLKQTLAVCILHLLKHKMGLIPCFSSAGFSLRQHFKTNRLSVGTMWKWFQWGFLQPSSHRGVERIRVPSASEVFAAGVGGSDRQRGSHLRWLGFREAPHHLLCFATAYCASRNQIQPQSHQLSQPPLQWSSERAATETTESAVPKMDRAYSVTWGNKNQQQNKSPSPLTTMHPSKKNPTQHDSYWLSLCSPIAVHRALIARGKQGTDVGWLKNLSLPLFYWLVTTEKFALIYFKSKWLDLHKTGGKSQFLMRMLNKDSL